MERETPWMMKTTRKLLVSTSVGEEGSYINAFPVEMLLVARTFRAPKELPDSLCRVILETFIIIAMLPVVDNAAS